MLVQPLAFDTTQVTSAANYSNQKPGDPCHPLAAGAHAPAVAYGFQPRIARNGRGDMGDVVSALNAQSGETGKGDAAPCVAIAFPANLSGTQHAATEDLAPSMGAKNPTAVAFQERGREGGRSLEVGGDVAFALTAPNGGGRTQERNVMTPAMQVRRLTPVECERLQGYPDGYTAIPWRGKPADQCPDGPRYKALGNSWAVPCAAYIGERIDAVNQILSERKTA